MRILLTGGAGYVGSACLRWLLKRGHDCVAFDNLSAGNAAAVPDGRLIVGDLLDTGAVADALSRHQAEAVMHFAAVASVPESIEQPELYWRVNLLGTKTLLDAMRANNVRQLLFSSTAATYCFDNPMPLKEESVLAPKVPYGTTKLACETLIREYANAYGLGYVILRYFNASGADTDGEYGEDRELESHLIPLIFQVALGKRKELQVFGTDWDTRDGTCVRDFVHTDDLALAHQLAIEAVQTNGGGTVYNVGSGIGTTVLEVLEACNQVIGRPVGYEIADRRAGDPGVLVASSEKIQNELGWQPKYGIKEIVETAWRWHSRHPQGYRRSVAKDG